MISYPVPAAMAILDLVDHSVGDRPVRTQKNSLPFDRQAISRIISLRIRNVRCVEGHSGLRQRPAHHYGAGVQRNQRLG